jgi:hypothetical protein
MLSTLPSSGCAAAISWSSGCRSQRDQHQRLPHRCRWNIYLTVTGACGWAPNRRTLTARNNYVTLFSEPVEPLARTRTAMDGTAATGSKFDSPGSCLLIFPVSEPGACSTLAGPSFPRIEHPSERPRCISKLTTAIGHGTFPQLNLHSPASAGNHGRLRSNGYRTRAEHRARLNSFVKTRLR